MAGCLPMDRESVVTRIMSGWQSEEEYRFLNKVGEKLPLNNGIQLPAFGLGTYRIRNANDMMKAVDCALAYGYRLFDTAAVYGNEKLLAEAFEVLLPKYELNREDIFITTKISPADHGRKSIVTQACQKSLKNLDTDYVDMLLIHFPGSAKLPANDAKNKILRHETWEALCKLHDEGLVNGVGVSNFTVEHLKELLKAFPGMDPAINQVEFHPYYQQKDLLRYCRAEGIQLQAYCSLGGVSSNANELLEDPVIKRIANFYGVTKPQLLFQWALQQDVAIIPKSTDQLHIAENICFNFEIRENYMKEIEALGVRNRKYAWDPTAVL